MKNKKALTFKFFDTVDAASIFCSRVNSTLSYYDRKKRRAAHFHEYVASDTGKRLQIAWYYE